ncbi:MAG: hypothetical protein QNJ12_05475 [Ilumatobacter sp.]|uniref:DUF6687 family protein n=1 Tax=Ilumatobacter sp. TaxID=1967498 RepID=UPI00260D85FC|nr:DUF6687 family protein [Ilumatobacter sp.]MDJ0768220.1 hypothetical protein [Ilumatobacter sp.]
MAFRYEGYETSRAIPNVVVDGSPNESTVLALTHWPGIAQPPGMARDLSAQMAFAYLDEPVPHPSAEVVTNNHFDQDGLVSIFALVEPEAALHHRALLIDVAAAGDFATYRDRRAARTSMALSQLASAETSLSYSDFSDQLYRELLPELLPMVLHNDRCQELWRDEDEALTESEAAIATGRVTIDERPDLDLAVVTIPAAEPSRSGHRFGGDGFEGIHPMALHNATERFRVITVHGRRYRYVDRYETWVQFRSRRVLPRIDLRPLADELTAMERSSVTWRAGAPQALTPELAHDGESSLEPETFVGLVVSRLAGGAAGSLRTA